MSKRAQQYNTPQDLAAALKARAANKKRVLGIDLGTNMGAAWADIEPGAPISAATIYAGQLDLSVLPYETGPLRLIRLKQFLSVLQPDLIGFEDVKYTPGGDEAKGPVGVILARVSKAAELLGSLKAVMVTWAEENGIPVQSFGIGQIKNYATGSGRANKEAMILAANEKYGVELSLDDWKTRGVDNLADAMHIAAMLIDGYSEGI